MIIPKNKNTALEEIRKLFSGYYPFLKLEFFNEPLPGQQASCFAGLLAHHKKMSDIKTCFAQGRIEIVDEENSSSVETGIQRLV